MEEIPSEAPIHIVVVFLVARRTGKNSEEGCNNGYTSFFAPQLTFLKLYVIFTTYH